MNLFTTLLKVILDILTVLVFLIYSLMGNLLIRNKAKQRKFNSHTVSFFSKIILKIMGVQLKVSGLPPENQHFLLVGNHLGFIDIMIIAAARPTLFITSMDMKETPGLGLITQMGGCIYVERRNRSNISNEILSIRDVLIEGHNVVLFPEAAAQNGEKIYPFKKTLMSAAAGTGVPILPMVINFRKVNGETMTQKYRDYVFWYGDISFFTVGWNANTLSSIEVDLDFLNPIFCHTEEQRREVAVMAQSQIESKYTPVLQSTEFKTSDLIKSSI